MPSPSFNPARLDRRVEGIPATGVGSGSVFVFSYRAGADLYPGFHGFYTFIYIAYYFRQVVSAPLGKAASFAVFAVVVAVGKTGGVFRIAQVVEVYPVYIVAFHHFADKTHQVLFGLRMSGIQEVFAFVGYADGAFLFGDGLFTGGRLHACRLPRGMVTIQHGTPYRACGIRLWQKPADQPGSPPTFPVSMEL